MEKTTKAYPAQPAAGRLVRLAVGLAALLIAYLLALSAFNTGSLQQYFLTAAFFIFAINRFTRAIQGNHHGKHQN